MCNKDARSEPFRLKMGLLLGFFPSKGKGYNLGYGKEKQLKWII